MDIIYIEFNNWFSGRDYPIGEPFETWIGKHQFSNDEWCKENKLCVYVGNIDMSVNWCITATREWVKENMPDLLSCGGYTYETILYHKGKTIHQFNVGHYSDFIRNPNEDGDIEGRFGWPFLEYSEENFGSHYYKDPEWSFDDDEDDDEEED